MSKSLSLRAVLSLTFILTAGLVLAQSQEPVIRRSAPQPRSPAPVLPQAPKAPFQLNPQEQQRMNQLLAVWERESDKVKLFRCQFTRWDYDFTFGPKKNGFLMSERHGEIVYRAPDNGTFKENDMRSFDSATGKYTESTAGLEHWVCDGKAIYQFQPKTKTLEITELPPEMRGKAITDGPLPFLFGAKAETLRQRYWIRETTPQAEVGRQVWLEAWPKHAQQAANFQRVEVILGEKDFLPTGMQVYTPNGKDRTAYLFEERKINDKIGDILNGYFLPPRTPLGWKKVVNPISPPSAQTPPAAALKQAARPKSGAVR